MRILWHSNSPLAGTGYGSQTATFTPRIRDLGHDIAISAYWGLGGSVIKWDGITVYPGDEQWGNRLLPMLVNHHGADVVITLMDVWVLTGKKLADVPLACWVPVDHEPCPPKVVEFFKRTGARAIAMSRFGERMLRDTGVTHVSYVPHGIDTKVFRPRPDEFAETRARMRIPEDGFVVGMVAANKGNLPSRKAFPQVIQAFAKLREKHDDAYLYLHTEPSGVGINRGLNLPKLAEACGLPDESVRFTSPLHLELGMSSEKVAAMMSAFDVLANPSYGEGFGVPIVEAQAVGTRVIVTDWTAMSELCYDGWAVDGDRFWNSAQESFWKSPSVDEIAAAMFDAYGSRTREPSQDAIRFAARYDADRVTEKYWRPTLEKLEAARRLASAGQDLVAA